jgi:molecular chaperone IbpA
VIQAILPHLETGTPVPRSPIVAAIAGCGITRGDPAHCAGHSSTIALKKGLKIMRTIDFAPLLRSSIGFENLNRLVDLATRSDGDAYPPYNIEKVGADAYRISMAVAGFSQDELDIQAQENTLTVVGRTSEGEGQAQREYLHRGIAKRAFERRFQLADTIRVTGANYANGLLNIELVREIPEHKKPRRIAIGDEGGVQVIEQREAA